MHYNIYKYCKELAKNKQGSALLITVLILTSILTAAFGAANLVVSGIKMSGTQERSTVAYFAAEAGAERVLWEIRKNGFLVSGCDNTVNKYVFFGAGPGDPAICDSSEHGETLSNISSYSVMYTSNLPITFVSAGSYAGVKRIVEIGY